MKIDFHTHCFPDALAPRAMESLQKIFSVFSYISPYTDGTAGDAKQLLQRAGIDRAVVCNIATNAHQEHKVNDFARTLAKADDFFIPIGSIHPDSQNQEAELDRLLEAGIKGIKIHPDYVGVFLDDARFDRIFSLLEEKGMFCVLHTGLDPISPDYAHATPQMLAEVIERHPRLKLIAAHMGGYALAQEVIEHLLGRNIYFDTSLCSLRHGERDALIHILKNHPADRLLFATDTPWSDPTEEIAFLESAGLERDRLEGIYYKNALQLLGK